MRSRSQDGLAPRRFPEAIVTVSSKACLMSNFASSFPGRAIFKYCRMILQIGKLSLDKY
jgi:hypothetical protein